MNKEEEKDEPQQVAEEDSRVACKYGASCYQKNPDHHKKYKHPSRNTKNASNGKDAGNSKKRKMPDEDKTTSSTDESKTKKQNVTADSEELQSSSSKEDENSKQEENAETHENSSSDENSKEKNITKEANNSNEGNRCNMEVAEITEKKDEANSKENSSITETKENQKTDEDKKMVPEKAVSEVNVSKKDNVTEDKPKNVDPYSEAKQLISKLFLVSMPNDFYKFYDFCNDLKPSDPATAFKIADIKLVGPYDVLSGLISLKTPADDTLLTHWRYYYDPPEFQTVLKGSDKEGLHFGYWRDRPSSDPVFVATNCSNVSHKIKPVAENIFGAVANYLEEKAKKANPFEKTGFFNLLGKLKLYAKTHNITLEVQTAKMKQREKNVVARTVHGAGIVCPYNKKTQLGYRELSVTDNQLLKIVKKINDAANDEDRESARAELGEIVRLATIAGDECDFGTCLELGHDLLSTGCVHVQNAALAVLNIAYNQLDRQAFLKIVEAHMKNRKKGTNEAALNYTAKDCSKVF